MTSCCSARWWPGPTVSASAANRPKKPPQSWALTVYRRSRLLDLMTAPFDQMMRWSYHWHPPSFGLRAAIRDVDSRVANILWYALLGVLGALCAPGASMTSPMAT